MLLLHNIPEHSTYDFLLVSDDFDVMVIKEGFYEPASLLPIMIQTWRTVYTDQIFNILYTCVDYARVHVTVFA
jgi:hypothetical protein